MKSWQESHRAKILSAPEAVRAIQPGDRVFVGSGAAMPEELIRALADYAPEVQGIELLHLLTLGLDPTTEERFAHHVRHSNFFIGANARRAVQEGRADYTPIFLSEIPSLFKSGTVPVDVALVHLSPPDRHGFCSYGVSVDIVKSATEAAKHVIAQINPCMPRVHGDSLIHLDDIDTLVEVDEALPELPRPAAGEVTDAIGRHVASLIEDGSTLQLGIGAIPDAVLANLHDKADLGVHTEMFSDGLLPLVASGVVNNRKKTLHRRKFVTSFVMGSRALYDFVDDNPVIEFRPSQYTNDPFLIARNHQMVAVNSALEVDLTGQVCADSIGHKFYSGIGGQVDFIRGAARSPGRQAHHRSTVHRPRRHRVPHRPSALGRCRRSDHPGRCALRGHRIRHRPPARQEHPSTRQFPHPYRPSRLPERACWTRPRLVDMWRRIAPWRLTRSEGRLRAFTVPESPHSLPPPIRDPLPPPCAGCPPTCRERRCRERAGRRPNRASRAGRGA